MTVVGGGRRGDGSLTLRDTEPLNSHLQANHPALPQTPQVTHPGLVARLGGRENGCSESEVKHPCKCEEGADKNRSSAARVRWLLAAGSFVPCPGLCALAWCKAAGDIRLLGTPGQRHPLTHPAWLMKDPSATLRLPRVL